MTIRGDLDVELREMMTAASLGQPPWGLCGDARNHRRYAMQSKRRRRRCGCGCGGVANWLGCANGVAMMSGCDFQVRQWVRDPNAPRCGAAS